MDDEILQELKVLNRLLAIIAVSVSEKEQGWEKRPKASIQTAAKNLIGTITEDISNQLQDEE